MVSVAFRRQLEGYGLTTATSSITCPIIRSLLQSYVWQDYDLAPVFPELKKFLLFWREKLDGALHSVAVSHNGLIGKADLQAITRDLRLH